MEVSVAVIIQLSVILRRKKYCRVKSTIARRLTRGVISSTKHAEEILLYIFQEDNLDNRGHYSRNWLFRIFRKNRNS